MLATWVCIELARCGPDELREEAELENLGEADGGREGDVDLAMQRLADRGTRGLHPRGEFSLRDAHLLSKPLEFEGFKIRVVQFLPQPKVLNRHSIAHPVADGLLSIVRFRFRHIRYANIILHTEFHNTDRRSLDINFLGLFMTESYISDFGKLLTAKLASC